MVKYFQMHFNIDHVRKTDPEVAKAIDLEFGRIKIRSGGSSAGHRGVKSIIDLLGSDEFSRLRIGIGRPGDNTAATDYVLSRFNQREKSKLSAIIKQAAEAAQAWVSEGAEKSMNIFNRNVNLKELKE